MVIQKGHTYSIAYRRTPREADQTEVKVGMAGPPYSEYWAQRST